MAAPFHPDLSPIAYGLRGRFLGKDAGWAFAPEHETRLREICMHLWGVDGRPGSMADTASIVVAVEEMSIGTPIFRKFNADIYLGGRQIAGVPKSRPVARPGKGVRFLAGKPALSREGLGVWLTIPTGAEFSMTVPRMALPFVTSCLAGHGHITQGV
ncbi:hypothetical protein K2X14_14005 [Acetobacter sp. TBRC 12305]|uniref:hypothetical protein n=1 Tax=Acetobacter garciniae TaxID=2817435 RepID=UPI001C72F272|nr:hypothetical protein [Acetobacter garciniae]MBX0345947.1 hypothetical protein [Acetobacter garciniae]